jgi:putative ABC transport system ATP-binding protein
MLKIENLSIEFNKKLIQKDLNFSVEFGESLAIIGKSGSGKSSLLNIIGLLSDNYQGDYYIDKYKNVGINSKNAKLIRRDKIGILFQNFGLVDNMTVLENLRLVKNRNDQKISELLIEFDLQEKSNQKVYELSGGEQQRIAFIRLILQDPDIVLIDEPGANLDDENRNFLINKIFEFKNKIIIIVTHNKEIAQLCDKELKL